MFFYLFFFFQLQGISHPRDSFRIYNGTSLAEEIQTWALNLPKLLCELKTSSIESIETSQVNILKFMYKILLYSINGIIDHFHNLENSSRFV